MGHTDPKRSEKLFRFGNRQKDFLMIGSEVDVPCLVKSRSKDTYTQNLVSVNEAKSVCSMLMDKQKKQFWKPLDTGSNPVPITIISSLI